MLAQELRNKEAQDRENKRLLAKLQILEAELNKPKSGDGDSGDNKAPSTGGNNDAIVKTLRAEAEEAQKATKDLEKKYHDVGGQLDAAKLEIEEQKRKLAEMEKKLAQAEVRALELICAVHLTIFFLTDFNYFFFITLYFGFINSDFFTITTPFYFSNNTIKHKHT